MDGGAVFEIVTNNPRLTADFAVSHGVASVHRVEGSPLDVLDRTEALLQEGRTLVSAPPVSYTHLTLPTKLEV